LTLANRQFYYKPLLSTDQIHDFKNCVVMTACSLGVLNHEDFAARVSDLKDSYGDDLYVEIQPHNFELQYEINRRALAVCELCDLKPVATNDCHYPAKDDAETQDVLLAVQTGASLKDEKRLSFLKSGTGAGLYLKDRGEMIATFKPMIGEIFPGEFLVQAIRSTTEIKEKCSGLKMPKLPYAVPAIFEDETKTLQDLCMIGWEKRIKGKVPNVRPYVERLKHELKVMTDIPGVTRYFLMVYDLVRYAKSIGVLCGFGRGSAGGSLVALLLGIINVDPVANDLYFERFLRPDRIDMPDIDLDFGAADRERVIAYVKAKYGVENVSQISTATEMHGKLAFRDVCRVYDVPVAQVNALSSRINNDLTLSENCDLNVDLGNFRNDHPEVILHAEKLEGQIRAKGMHAGGVIISEGGFDERGVLERRKDDMVAVNWTMNECDHFGLLKVDILGLSNLSVLKDTVRLVKKHHGIDIDLHSIKPDEPEVLKQFSDGFTSGFFQFESQGITRLCQELAPIKDFESLVHINALYRPGPLDSGMVESYKKRKRLEEAIDYRHPKEEEITQQTLGLPIFQEQVMALCVKLAGFSWPEADNVRKAIAKSKGHEAVEKYRDQFVEGCRTTTPGLDSKVAVAMFDQIVKFGRYSFNKCISHSEKIYTPGLQDDQFHPTIGEMYKIRNDYEYAKRTGHLSLHKKYRLHGYCGSLSMNGEQRLVRNKIVDIRYSGVMPVFQVTTRTGRTLKCTGNHLVPTTGGKKLLQEIKVGDFLFAKGEAEKIQYNYNLYEDGKAPCNLPQRGERGFQKIETGHSAVFFKVRGEKIEAIGACEKCGARGIDRFELHHIDFDRTNNDPDNFMLVCPSCHKKLHYAAGRTKAYENGIPTVPDEVISIEYVGEEECYDVEMEAPHHTFLTQNGIVVCNSHSACYSYIAYLTAWAKHHYPREFMAGLLGSITDEPEKTAEYRHECNRLGIEIELPDMNDSEIGFSIQGRNLVPGFDSIKGVGGKAAQVIMEARKGGRFVSFEDFMARTVRRTVNKRIVAALAFAGVFRNATPYRTVKYIIENYDLVNSGKAPKEVHDEYDKKFIDTQRMKFLPGLYGTEEIECELKLDILPGVLEGMIEDIISCEACPLKAQGHIPFTYSTKSRVMVISDFPLRSDVRNKVEAMFRDVLGLTRGRLLRGHVFNCRPEYGKLAKDVKARWECPKKHLEPLLKATAPEVIFVMGNTAMEYFTGRDGGITKMNATTEWSPRFNTMLVFAVSPGSMFQSGKEEANEELFIEALKKLGEYL